MNCPTSSTLTSYCIYMGRKNNDRHWFEQEAASVVDCGVLEDLECFHRMGASRGKNRVCHLKYHPPMYII